jgi:outer membrane protein OmpA-like peptidoglycan-associated protein
MKGSHTRVAAAVALVAALLLPQVAAADKNLVNKGEGGELRLFRPSVDTKGHFTQDGTQILPHLAFSLGLMLDFGFHDWVAVEADGDIYDKTMIDTFISSSLLFNLGLMNMIVVGLQIPLMIPAGSAYNGVDVQGDPDVGKWGTKGGIGDISLHVKLRWIRADLRPVGLGTVIQYQAPVGKSELLMGEPGGGALSGKMIADIEPRSWYRAALNVGARIPFGASDENTLNEKEFWLDGAGAPLGAGDRLLFKYGPTLTFGVGQSFTLWPKVMDFVLEVYGSHLLTDMGNMGYFSLEAGGGFKIFVERSSYLMAGYAHGIPLGATDSLYGFQSVEHRMFLGFAFEPSIGDRDGDGIPDDVDQCPDDPEDFDGFEDWDGCPEPDNDRDGILDIHDQCPLVPGTPPDGCPDRIEGDRDGDGIPDSVDKCPDDPEDFDGFEDEDGCPDPDNDGDGILDIHDQCPNEPEDFDGWEDEDGCPDPDNDGDGIPDVDDMCPNEPETYNGFEDDDGCPDQGIVVLTDTDIKILKKVYFEYDSAVIKPESYDVLDAVAATINGNPQIELVEVQGHADERGDDDYNLRLTVDRAASVVSYLINKGVKANKLRSAGYGEYCPVDPASNDAAWEKNRRVEFKVLVVDGNPTGVEIACENAIKKGVKVPPVKINK